MVTRLIEPLGLKLQLEKKQNPSPDAAVEGAHCEVEDNGYCERWIGSNVKKQMK